MKLKYLILFLLLNSICSFSQNKINGNWYTFSTDIIKIIESKYDSTQVKNTNLDWDFSKIEEGDSLKIVKIISKEDKLYYILNNEKENKIILSIIDNITTDISFRQTVIDEKKVTFKNISNAEKFIKKDTISRLGLIYFSEKEINRIKLLPSLQTISKNDYLQYLKTVLATKNASKKSDKSNTKLMFLFLNLPNKAREILINQKYNGLVSDGESNEMNKKFSSDIDVQKILSELNQF